MASSRTTPPRGPAAQPKGRDAKGSTAEAAPEKRKRAGAKAHGPSSAAEPGRRRRSGQAGAGPTEARGRLPVRVRMYRQGLGDCFLVTLPRQDGGDFHILIDCGVILGTDCAGARLTEVVDDV